MVSWGSHQLTAWQTLQKWNLAISVVRSPHPLLAMDISLSTVFSPWKDFPPECWVYSLSIRSPIPYIYIYTYTHIHIHTHTYIYMYIYMYIYIYMYLFLSCFYCLLVFYCFTSIVPSKWLIEVFCLKKKRTILFLWQILPRSFEITSPAFQFLVIKFHEVFALSREMKGKKALHHYPRLFRK